ncbi:MAG TPA: LamG-like jellyroll fold domain-containing protein [Baekduia sp.]|nr:LamG-like jellyroll fold domain-containing protein [Baekduia sp.]
MIVRVGGGRATRCPAVIGALTCAAALFLAPAAFAVDPGLTGQWHLDATAGSGTATTTPDSSGLDQNGTFTGAPTLVPGRFGQALSTGAANSWMSVSRPGSGTWGLESPQVSLTAWIKRSGFPGVLRYLASKGDFPGCAGSSYTLYTGYGSVNAGLQFAYLDTAGAAHFSPRLDAASSVWDGNWHAVTGTFDGAMVRLYLDGTEVGTGTPADVPIRYAGPAHDEFTVGTYADKSAGSPCGTGDWPGAVDEVRVHNRALTPAEITTLHDPDATTPPDLAPPPAPPAPPTPTTPATPSPAPAPRNLVPPEVIETRGKNDAATYRCSDGQWEGLAPDPKFARTLYELQPGLTDGRPNPPKVVSRGAPVLVRATARRRPYYCSVTAPTRDGGFITADGPILIIPNYRIGSGTIRPQTIGDLRIRGIDVFQVVQPTSGAGEFSFNGYPKAGLEFPTVCGGGTPTALLPPLCQSAGAVTQKAPYQGVDLDADKRTSAVVYVDLKPGVIAQIPNQQIRVRLHASAGARLSASMSQTLRVKDLQTAPTDAVTAAERGDERFGLTFDIPQTWLAAATSPTNGTFDLDATVTATNASFNTRQCNTSTVPILGMNDCQDNDSFTLTGIFARYLSFSALLRPIALLTPSQTLASLKSPDSAMQGARTLLPSGEKFQIPDYVAQVPIDPVTATNATNCPAPAGETPAAVAPRLRKCASANVTNAVRGWVASGPPTDPNQSGADGFDVLLALHNYQYAPGATEPGASFNTSGVGAWGRHLNQPYIQINDGTIGRPYTSASHELLHTYGAPHAGINVGGIVGDLSCGGDTDGQVGEVWPPDDAGRLQGVKFDPATDQRIVDDDTIVAGNQGPLYDFMSYCANESSAWISPRNWNRAFAFMVDAESIVPTTFQVAIKGRALDARASGSGVVPTLRGTGFALGSVLDGRVRIDGLEPADPAHDVPAGDADSPVRIRALDATGKVLGEAGARLQKDTSTGTTTFIAPVPAGATTVQAIANGAVADQRAKGRPPVLTLRSPRRATRVGRRLELRWQASDPDGSPLTAQVEFSADGRHRWRTVQRGPSTGRAVLPAQLLQTATAGRVRVRVSDGFDVVQALSGPLRIAGRPPSATLVRPAPGEHVPSSSRVALRGQGTDETGRRLRGRALTWFAGRRRLGSGERLQVRLPAGRVTLSLVVKDARGRTDTARRTLHVDPPPLELRTLRVGDARAGARTVVLTMATNVPAVLRARGRTARVGPRALKVRVPLPARPKVGVLEVPVTITPVGGGKAITTRVTVLRG